MGEARQQATVSRRDFVKSAGVTAVLGASAAAMPATAGAATSERRPHYGMLIDLDRCIGCHACSVACKAEFDVPLGVTRSWVEYIEKGDYPSVSRSFLPRLCNHCDNPPCVSVCPTDATWKREEDGIVVIDPDLCIGCKYCIQACPYDARFLNPVTGVADKCDFCQHRVEQGLVPSCVNACIGSARIFGDANDPDSEISKRIATSRVSVLRQEMGTKPNVHYIGADHTNPQYAEDRGQHVRVETHRRQQERR